MGVLGSEIADSWANSDSETPFVGPEPACGIPGRAVRGTSREWSSRSCLECWKFVSGLRQVKLLILGSSVRKTRELL